MGVGAGALAAGAVGVGADAFAAGVVGAGGVAGFVCANPGMATHITRAVAANVAVVFIVTFTLSFRCGLSVPKIPGYQPRVKNPAVQLCCVLSILSERSARQPSDNSKDLLSP